MYIGQDHIRELQSSSPLRGNAITVWKRQGFCCTAFVAKEGWKISYRDTSEEPRRAQTAARAEARKKKHSLSDRDSEYGPPDKAQHFCEDDDFSPLPKTKPMHKKSQKGKECVTKSSPKPKNPGGCRNVEVLYDDGKCYRGWLDSFNFKTGKWIVKFLWW